MSDTHDQRPDPRDGDVQRVGARTTLEERTYEGGVRPAGITRTVSAGDRRDRVRWGPIWAGLLVVLAVNVLLQLAIVATGLLSINTEGTGLADGALWSGIAALVAFFVGGLVTGASTMWREAADGAYHGIILWALAVVSVLLLTVLGSGLALGTASDVATDLGINVADVEEATEQLDEGEASDAAESAAGAALLGLGLTLVAATAGAIAGSKMWPSKDRRQPDVDLTEQPRSGSRT